MPTPQEDRKILTFQRGAVTAFKALINSLKSYGEEAKSAYKGRGEAVLDQRKRHIVKLIKTLPEVRTFMEKFVGSDEVSDKAYSWRNTTLYLIRDHLAGQKTLKDVVDTFTANSIRSFKAIELNKSQAFLKSVIPAELRAYLPDTIVIDVDEGGYIKRINDMFGNKTYTLAEKIKSQKSLIKKYNTIVKLVKRDFKSRDEMTRLSAIITSIIMETGIRPGHIGNGIVETVDDQEVEVETFGAITLNTSHVSFVRENFAELRFRGKMGTVNTAAISDSAIVSVLRDYVNNALQSGSEYIFVTGGGVQYTYQDLVKYFRTNFEGFKITDFRKLRATQEVFDGLREERDSMLQRIREVAALEVEELTRRVVEIVADTINKAHERAQVALSHGSGSTTRTSYINPEVLLRFLSTASMQSTLKESITTGKTRLYFDPMMFVQEATRTAGLRMISASGRTLESMDTIVDMLEHIFEDVEV